MKTYEYRGFDYGGVLQRGLIEALDLKEAREKLATKGILAEKVEAVTEGKRRLRGTHRGLFNLEVRSIFYSELESLLRAGLPLDHALRILIDAPELGPNRAVLASIRDSVQGGSSLAEAMAASSDRVSSFERAVIQVGERAGTLDAVIGRLAEFLREQEALREKVRTALYYPSIVIVLALIIGIAVLGFMIPFLGRLLEGTNVQLPTITRLVMWMGDALWVAGLPLLLILAGAGWTTYSRAMRDEEFRTRLDRRLYQLPVIGRAYTALVNLRFSRTLALLLGGGVTLVEGLPMAGRATGSPWVSERVDSESDEVQHGKSLADAIRSVPPLSGALPGWIQAGEASGNLAALLETAGERFQQQWDRTISRFLALLEPMLIILVGGFVLLIALAILLPIFSLNQVLM